MERSLITALCDICQDKGLFILHSRDQDVSVTSCVLEGRNAEHTLILSFESAYPDERLSVLCIEDPRISVAPFILDIDDIFKLKVIGRMSKLNRTWQRFSKTVRFTSFVGKPRQMRPRGTMRATATFRKK